MTSMKRPGANHGDEAPKRKASPEAGKGAGKTPGGERVKPPQAERQKAPVARGSASVKAYSDEGPGAVAAKHTRTYVEFPDFRKKPAAFIDKENWPFEGDVLLLNGLWLRPEKYEPAARRWSVNESGAHPSGCAMSWSHHKTRNEAILAALDRKPFEHPADKRVRVEAEARLGADPEILTVIEGVLDQCRNIFGPIDDDTKYRIRNYVLEPTVENWEDIHSIIVKGDLKGSTIWNAWIDMDPRAPRRGPAGRFTDEALVTEWDRIPTPMEVLVILQDAIRDLPEVKKA